MNQPKPTLRIVGVLCFSIAFVLGILLTAARVFPDLESTLYGFVKYDYPGLPSLSCPLLMTSLDRQPVTIRLRNPGENTITYYVVAQFSGIPLIVNNEQRVEVQPGETKTLTWEVGSENIDLNNFIFANIFASPSAYLKMTSSTCGSFVINLPIKGGSTIFYAGLVLAALTAVIGLWLWPRHSDFSNQATVYQFAWMRFVTVVLAIGVVAGILSYWFLGVLLLALILLSVVVFLIPRII